MANDTLTLLQAAIRKRGGSLAAITPTAEDMCKLMDHWNAMHWHDRNRLTAEVKELKAKVAQLESKGQDE